MRIEISDDLHDRAKIAAVRLGLNLREFVTQALDEKVAAVEKEQER